MKFWFVVAIIKTPSIQVPDGGDTDRPPPEYNDDPRCANDVRSDPSRYVNSSDVVDVIPMLPTFGL